jgi:lipopolysaccharide transport system permease protein
MIVIEAKSIEYHYWKDLWRYHELFYFLAWRDIIVRYKQAVIGVLWALLRPLLTMMVFTIVFSKIAKLPSDSAPYPILVFVAMLPWQFFANSLSGAGESLIANANMISKVYFPRLIVPCSAVLVSFVDFVISACILVLLMIWYGYSPGVNIFYLPFFLAMVLFACLGFGIWAAALNVRYRDFRVITPFVVQFGLYASPVGFSSDLIPEKWRLIYSLNPMVGIIDGFRWSILSDPSPLYLPGIITSFLIISFILVSGFYFFRKSEKTFADVI